MPNYTGGKSKSKGKGKGKGQEAPQLTQEVPNPSRDDVNDEYLRDAVFVPTTKAPPEQFSSDDEARLEPAPNHQASSGTLKSNMFFLSFLQNFRLFPDEPLFCLMSAVLSSRHRCRRSPPVSFCSEIPLKICRSS
jgi:hypothetical protein